MEQKSLYDITEVCRMLGTTSRTLRFYEEKGIIQSTTVGISSRRQYTAEQLTNIKSVFVLRTLGLSVKTISELQAEKSELKSAVISKKAEIYASINARIREINLLNETLTALEVGGDIFSEGIKSFPCASEEDLRIARLCTEAVLNGDTDALYERLSPRLIRYMPREVFNTIREDTLAPLGKYISVGKVEVDASYPNKIYVFAEFSKLGLKITFVFHGGRIDGLWLGYYNKDNKNER